MSNAFSFSVPEEIKNNPDLASNLIDTVPLTLLTERIIKWIDPYWNAIICCS